MNRAYYADTIAQFLDKSSDEILGELVRCSSLSGASIESTQTDAWQEEIRILKLSLVSYRDLGSVYFEYSIPRLGKRIDVVAILGGVVFVLEFKVGERSFPTYAIDQVY